MERNSTSEKLHSTVGVLFRWCRTLKVRDLPLFHSDRALRMPTARKDKILTLMFQFIST
nr:MAG TPA: hypothetical protein [Caudoviricetes sp.]